MTKQRFDAEGFYAALDAQRQSKNLTWKKVAEEAEVSASTLTRMAQGKRPDVDSMAALANWSGLSTDTFVGRAENSDNDTAADPLAQITAYLRADKQLSPEAAAAMESVIKTTYDRLRKVKR